MFPYVPFVRSVLLSLSMASAISRKKIFSAILCLRTHALTWNLLGFDDNSGSDLHVQDEGVTPAFQLLTHAQGH